MISRVDMEIRELNKNDDLKALVKLSEDFFYEYEGNHPYFFKIDEIEEGDITCYFQRFIENDERKAFIAMDKDSVVGYITVLIQEQAAYWKVKRIGHVSGLMVHSTHRRKGIGKKLLQAAIEYFKAEGIGQYTLFTSVNNTGGIEFYEKCGLEKLYTTLLGEVE